MSIINLLPEDYIQSRQRRRTNTMCIGLFVVVMAGVLGAMVVSEQSLHNTLSVRDRVNASYIEANKLIEQMQHLQATKSKMLAKAARTSSLIERIPRSTLLAVVTNALPKGSSLVKLDLKTKRVVKRVDPKNANNPLGTKLTTEKRKPHEKKIIKIVSMEITGLAGTDIDVARFIANLARNPMSESVDLVYSQQKKIDDIQVRRFQIKVVVKNQFDAANIGAKNAASAKKTSPTGHGVVL